MSWGERSCENKMNCPIPNECSFETCNVNCRKYEWDKTTKPDSVLKSDEGKYKMVWCNECCGKKREEELVWKRHGLDSHCPDCDSEDLTDL